MPKKKPRPTRVIDYDPTTQRAMPLGLVRGMPITTYHDNPNAISCTGLLDLMRSPMHYHALHVNPERPDPPKRAGQLVGTLAHVALLEPDQIEHRYAVGPTVNRNTKVWKDFVDDEATRAPQYRRTCIQQEQLDVARAQAASLRKLPDVAALLRDGEAEISAYWIDAATGVRCRCRPDHNTPAGRKGEGAILLDLKTCGDASPAEFSRQISRKNYHVQDAFYSDGFEAAAGVPVIGFVFAAVEDAWPFASCAVMLDDASRAEGRRVVRTLLDRYAECIETNAWPAYSDTIELVTLSKWKLLP